MKKRILNEEIVESFRNELKAAERSEVTIQKYIRDVRGFCRFAEGREVTKELVIRYKEKLIEDGYAARSVNSILSALNSLFKFLMWTDCSVKHMKLQKQIYCAEERELKKSEYIKLLHAAEKNPRLHMILQTICGTGIRISELRYFTMEAVKSGRVTVSCKSKTRIILIPGKLQKRLLSYGRKAGVHTGVIFRTRTGNPVNRSNIWAEMKKLCESAGVNSSKVFPHNLRKLFARLFYDMEKDIAELADILGHSRIDTTRIYIMTTEDEHRKKIDRLGLII